MSKGLNLGNLVTRFGNYLRFGCSSFQGSSISKYHDPGRGGGIVVSVFAFYSGDQSSNPADYLFSVLFSKKMKIHEKKQSMFSVFFG